jgi:hypothetical protein
VVVTTKREPHEDPLIVDVFQRAKDAIIMGSTRRAEPMSGRGTWPFDGMRGEDCGFRVNSKGKAELGHETLELWDPFGENPGVHVSNRGTENGGKGGGASGEA